MCVLQLGGNGETMPVENSRLSGFFKLTVEERRNLVKQLSGIDDEHVAALSNNGELTEEDADRMIENVIGTMSLPVGIATNFVIDGQHYLIPFCLEESSVVAAASNMAKRCLKNGVQTAELIGVFFDSFILPPTIKLPSLSLSRLCPLADLL